MRTPSTLRRRTWVATLPLVLLLSACNFSFSVGGGLDYEALETAISEELDATYASIDASIVGVDCPELADDPEPGDTLICTADLSGTDVRVEVEVEDEDYNVVFNTLDIVYDLEDTEQVLAADIAAQVGFDVNLNCGEGIIAVAIGDSYDCTAIDANSDTATVRVTANGPDDTSWEIVE